MHKKDPIQVVCPSHYRGIGPTICRLGEMGLNGANYQHPDNTGSNGRV